MSVECIIGLQWGDEGKGKLVDALAENFDMVVRFAGGSNAGHTVVFDGQKYILHLIPTGILHKDKTCVIANGVAFDPEIFFDEVEKLHSQDYDTMGRLFVSDRAHVAFDFHKQFDLLGEKARGAGKIGTTARGIGPCYSDKASRLGARVCDLMEPRVLEQLLMQNLAAKNILFAKYGFEEVDVQKTLAVYLDFGKKLKPYVRQTRELIAAFLKEGRSVLFEGAQGALLDIDHGTYPYVTSSSTGVNGITSGAGTPARNINRVTGVIKSYCTRVGSGPFPTEEKGLVGEHLQTVGGEFGATTGRPRRCGWLDLVSVRYTAAINSVDAIALTKLDVLSGLEKLKIAVSYEHSGSEIKEFPASQNILESASPRYETLEGWPVDISGMHSLNDLPKEAVNYIQAVEGMLGIPVTIVSVGNSRKQTIFCEE